MLILPTPLYSGGTETTCILVYKCTSDVRPSAQPRRCAIRAVFKGDERLRSAFGSEHRVEFVRRSNRPRVDLQRARHVRGDAPDHHAGVLHRLQVLHAASDDVQPPIPWTFPHPPHRLSHDPGLPALPGRPDGDVTPAVRRSSAADQSAQHAVDQRRPRVASSCSATRASSISPSRGVHPPGAPRLVEEDAAGRVSAVLRACSRSRRSRSSAVSSSSVAVGRGPQ